MKNTKRTLLSLIAAALTAAALAVPSAASAAEWSYGGNWLKEDAQVGLEGTVQAQFSGGLAGYECQVEATATLFALSGDGEITEASFSNCKGKNSWSGYTVSNTALELPWAIHATSNNDIELDSYVTRISLSGGGSWVVRNSAAYPFLLQPEDPEELANPMGFTAAVEMGGISYPLQGSLNLTSGGYGIQ